LRKQEGIAARPLEAAIRTGEVIGARWGEIDKAGKVWTGVASNNSFSGVQIRCYSAVSFAQRKIGASSAQ
jgi:hypothetical protein